MNQNEKKDSGSCNKLQCAFDKLPKAARGIS